MKLLTQAIRKALPPLYANESKSAAETMVVVKFFYPAGAYTAYATEFDGEDSFFGFVTMGDPDNAELGYFSLSEMESLKGPFGLGIERDIGWKPRPLSEVMEKVKNGGHV